MTDATAMMDQIGARARAAAEVLAYAATDRKHAALVSAAHALRDDAQQIIDANCEDLVHAEEKGLSPAMIDRLMLDDRASGA